MKLVLFSVQPDLKQFFRSVSALVICLSLIFVGIANALAQYDTRATVFIDSAVLTPSGLTLYDSLISGA